METFELDGRHMRTHEEYHEYLAHELSFPEWYGNNLDALYDLLTERGQTKLTIEHSGAMSRRLRSVLEDAAQANVDLVVAFL